MKFLVDNALSPVVSRALLDAGHDAVHVRDLGMSAAPDEDIFDTALSQDRVIVSADTDFATILAVRDAAAPSLLLFRGNVTRVPAKQVMLLLAHLERIESDLAKGCVAVFDSKRIRIRRLPL